MNLLDLPFHIRRRIYIAVGLVINADIDILSLHLFFLRTAEFPFCSTPVEQTTFVELRSSLNLFLVSRAIHSETSLLFFSSNRFHFRSSRDNARPSFRLLCSFVQSAHGQLRSLVVNLNRARSACTCDEPTSRSRWSENDHNGSATFTQALDQSISADAGFLKDWIIATFEIGPLVPSKRLELTLVCDCASVETAELVASSLRHFPTLSQCHLRLCQELHAGIQQTAREAALRAIGQIPTAPKATHFPMRDLPVELRLHILSYTDLVTPLRELQWEPIRKYHLEFRHYQCPKVLEWWGRFERCPALSDWVPHDWADFRIPGRCKIPRDKGSFHHSCKFRDCWLRLDKGDCFCRRYHSSYSTALDRCLCWSPPIALLLVCRQFSQEALHVFFAWNRIIVLPCGGLTKYEPPASSPPIPFAASTFLRSGLALDSLKHLRLLDVIFPPIDDGPQDSSFKLALTDWLDTLEWARSKLDLSRLTIRCEITDYFLEEHVPEHRRRLELSRYIEIIRSYSAIGHSFMLLHQGTQPGMDTAESSPRLRSLFIHLADPLFWKAEAATSTWRENQAEKWRQRKLEERFEKNVMGAEYNSLTAGKEKLKWAEWRWRLVVDWFHYLD